MTMTDDRRELPAGAADPSSPLAQFREQRKRKQQKLVKDIDMIGSEGFVARVTIIDDSKAAADALRFAVGFTDGQTLSEGSDLVNDCAAFCAAAVTGLYHRDSGSGKLEALMDQHGLPVRFDERYGPAVGDPSITSGVGAVFDAFTKGDPPRVNATALLAFAMEVAGFNVSHDDAETVVKGS